MGRDLKKAGRLSSSITAETAQPHPRHAQLRARSIGVINAISPEPTCASEMQLCTLSGRGRRPERGPGGRSVIRGLYVSKERLIVKDAFRPPRWRQPTGRRDRGASNSRYGLRHSETHIHPS